MSEGLTKDAVRAAEEEGALAALDALVRKHGAKRVLERLRTTAPRMCIECGAEILPSLVRGPGRPSNRCDGCRDKMR